MSQWLLEEITARLLSTTGRAESLRTQLAEAEDDLERLHAAEQVVKEILAGQQDGGPSITPAPDRRDALPDQAAEGDVTAIYQVLLPAGRAAEPSPGGLLIPYRHQAHDVHDLPGDYQALLTAVHAADGPVICKAICERLGLPTEPGPVEGVRAKLKRLVERGWLRKTPSGAFGPLT
ncbi:hypothetical protein [Planomonospora parontospora]|uniref:hypothetical protein n=1 Tax=Planomonospora parontospora TaxID=58119 RepID=UPI001945B776|nr:hypothetical protein [Planomonospora parontospora]GGL60202.1 hypothetical protein GCM10014719_71670 [Planomonospora parontospora subsp. antibiotica]GII20381.1 hypothetical protein Ppa05_71070 [Planomonospora parontospora subsp. antibiotica]